MQKEFYRDAIYECLKQLIEIRELVFGKTLNLAMAGELSEWNDMIEDGEQFVFSKEILLACNDVNVQLLTELLTKIESTCDTLENLNNLNIRNDEI